MDENSILIGQVWKSKYSGKKIKIKSHIVNGVWEYESVLTQKTGDVTEIELISNWKLSK